MRHYLLTLILLLSCTGMFAQTDNASASSQINQIKMDTLYIYAESTNSNIEEATENARTVLATNIEDWVRQTLPNSEVSGCIGKAASKSLIIRTRRGNLHRVFVYVKKTDLITFSDNSEVILVPVNQTPPQETEEPKPDTVAVQETTDTIAVAQVPDRKEDLLSSVVSSLQSSVQQTPQSFDDFLAVTKAADIEPFLKKMMQDGAIRNYGRYDTLPEFGTCYAFIYNKEGNVVAHLRKRDKVFYNMDKEQPDALTNYSGCGIIWFQKYKK